VIEWVVFSLIVAVALAVGIKVGMLAAPRIGRLADRDDETPNDG